MTFHRHLLSLAATTCLLAAAHAAPPAPTFLPVSGIPTPNKFTLAKNPILSVKPERAPDGAWVVTVDYEYTGEPEGAQLQIKQAATATASNADPVGYHIGAEPLRKGRHQVRLPLGRPGGDERFTQQLTAEVWDSRHRVVASLSVPHQVEWADATTQRVDQEVAAQSTEIVLKRAIGLIDTDNPGAIRQAKLLLERLIKVKPQVDQAYVELARVAMKTNWNADGLREAEALIKSALQVRADSVNAKILLGYVYSNQGRTKEAETLFSDAARSGTRNLWLWTNWGEMLMQQGQAGPAIAKFREAIKHPPTNDTNDRARIQAYHWLLRVQDPRGTLDTVEALHRQRRADYPGMVCFDLAHARFLVTMRGDAAGADAILKTVPAKQCESGEGRMLVTLVRYVAWAGAKEPQRAEALRQARVSMPVGPRLFQVLAESDQTLAAAKQLVTAGESVTMQDSQRMDALAYALVEGDAAAATRLLSIGARTDALVGAEQVPVALLPVLSGELAGIAVMQRAGVDYAQLRFRGKTAADIAREQGNERMLRALQASPRRL